MGSAHILRLCMDMEIYSAVTAVQPGTDVLIVIDLPRAFVHPCSPPQLRPPSLDDVKLLKDEAV
jgi:hypothetical protein